MSARPSGASASVRRRATLPRQMRRRRADSNRAVLRALRDFGRVGANPERAARGARIPRCGGGGRNVGDAAPSWTRVRGDKREGSQANGAASAAWQLWVGWSLPVGLVGSRGSSRLGDRGEGAAHTTPVAQRPRGACPAKVTQAHLLRCRRANSQTGDWLSPAWLLKTRRRADSNRCTRLCRPLPNHSATSPG